MLKWIRRILITLCALASVAYLALPGWHRALTPTLFGMHKIAPNIYSDAPDKSKTHLALISAARTQASDFFGPLQTNPRYILCTTEHCTKRFGLRTRGLNLGYHLIFIGPKGINASIITHEIAHSELHRSMGLRDWNAPKFPSWFDEGLASYISNDTRLTVVSDPQRIKAVRNYRQWSKLNSAQTWQQNYSAAWTLVKNVADARGIEALKTLINRVEAGEDFDPLWQALESQP